MPSPMQNKTVTTSLQRQLYHVSQELKSFEVELTKVRRVGSIRP